MLLSEMKGKRCVIAYMGQRGSEIAVARVEDVDDTFIKISTELPKSFEKEIVSRAYTYIRIEMIETITDAEDEKVFQSLIRQLQSIQQAQAAAQKAAFEQARKRARDTGVPQQMEISPENLAEALEEEKVAPDPDKGPDGPRNMKLHEKKEE